MIRSALILPLLLMACGKGPYPAKVYTSSHGIEVYQYKGAEYPDKADLELVTTKAVEYVLMAKGWYPEPIEAYLADLVVVFMPKPFECIGTTCAGEYEPNLNSIKVWVDDPMCLPLSAYGHELGHMMLMAEIDRLDYEHEDTQLWEAIQMANWYSCVDLCGVCVWGE